MQASISFYIRMIFDVLIVWACIYSVFRVVRNNARTIQLVKGLMIIFIIKALAGFLSLDSVEYIINTFLNWGIVAVLIIFQPEIRSILEKVGNTTRIVSLNLSTDDKKKMIENITQACKEMSKEKTGALISIEQGNSLTDYIATGTDMDAKVSKELLETIFRYGTPLHDGAVIIQGDRIACAAAYFPPTTKDLPSKYGARHRAAIGISEITDSITIIVSEETGNISVAIKGILRQYTVSELSDFLTEIFIEDKKASMLEPSYYIQPAINTVKNLTRSSKKSENDIRVKPIKIIDKDSTRQGAK